MKAHGWKRWVALVAVICLTLTMTSVVGFAEAGEGGMDNLPVKDMAGRTFRIGTNTTVKREDYDDWLLELEKKYNCFIEFTTPGDYNAIATSIMGGDPLADLINMNDTYFYSFVNRKLLLDLSSLPYMYPTDTEYYWKSTTDIATVNGKIYGVDPGMSPFRRILVYNKELINGEDDLQTLEENGQLTWDKLAEVMIKVTKSGVAGLSGQMYISDVLETFVAANGGRIFNRDGLVFSYAYDTQNTRNAIAFVQELYKNGCILENVGNWQWPQVQFARGKAGIFIADSWNLGYIYEKAKFDVGMVLVPAGPDAPDPDKGLIEQTVFNCWAIPSTVENPEDVALIYSAYIKARSDNEEGKGSWALEWEDTMDDEKNMAVLEAYAAAMDAGDVFVDYKNSVTQLYNDNIFGWQEDATRGGITPQAYLETVGAIYKAKADDFNK